MSVERALCKYDGGLSAVEDDQPVRGAGRQEAPLSARPDRVDAGGRRDLQDAARLEAGWHLDVAGPGVQRAVALPREPLLLRDQVRLDHLCCYSVMS